MKTLKTKTPTITVIYWVGTTRHKGKAKTYSGAMRIASRNQNAWPPTFYDDRLHQLYDDGRGLAYPEEEVVKPGVVRRLYAV